MKRDNPNDQMLGAILRKHLAGIGKELKRGMID